jgi:hypothetical protein
MNSIYKYLTYGLYPYVGDKSIPTWKETTPLWNQLHSPGDPTIAQRALFLEQPKLTGAAHNETLGCSVCRHPRRGSKFTQSRRSRKTRCLIADIDIGARILAKAAHCRHPLHKIIYTPHFGSSWRIRTARQADHEPLRESQKSMPETRSLRYDDTSRGHKMTYPHYAR